MIIKNLKKYFTFEVQVSSVAIRLMLTILVLRYWMIRMYEDDSVRQIIRALHG